MKHTPMIPRRLAGFTLVEIAVVLVIIAIIVSAIAVPLAVQVERVRIAETQKKLDEIREAIYGFAIVNRRLPRPATSATNGAERALVCTTEINCTGFIPWTALGVQALDAWGKVIRYSVTPAFADGNFILATPATKGLRSTTTAASNDVAAAVPAIIWSHGSKNWGTDIDGNPLANTSTTNFDETTNCTGLGGNCLLVLGDGQTFVSKNMTSNTAATGGEFDDVLIWIPTGVLMSKMVAAGVLPP